MLVAAVETSGSVNGAPLQPIPVITQGGKPMDSSEEGGRRDVGTIMGVSQNGVLRTMRTRQQAVRQHVWNNSRSRLLDSF